MSSAFPPEAEESSTRPQGEAHCFLCKARQEAQEPDVPESVATTDTAIDRPTISEVQVWQLPPQVDLRAIAVARRGRRRCPSLNLGRRWNSTTHTEIRRSTVDTLFIWLSGPCTYTSRNWPVCSKTRLRQRTWRTTLAGWDSTMWVGVADHVDARRCRVRCACLTDFFRRRICNRDEGL